jgi:CBS domain-containing protein
VDPRIAALVGMAAIFAGASRALLASIVFAFETTRSMAGLLPLLGGCTASYLLSAYMMRTTIMTEKIVRRGVRVPAEYSADFLDQVLVRETLSQPVVTLPADETLGEARAWLHRRSRDTHHQGFPIVDARGALVGVLTRRDLLDPQHDEAAPLRRLISRAPVVAHPDHSLRQAADHMVRNRVGRLAIVERADTTRVVGVLTRSDLLSAHRRRLDESHRRKRTMRIRHPLKGRTSQAGSPK